MTSAFGVGGVYIILNDMKEPHNILKPRVLGRINTKESSKGLHDIGALERQKEG